MQIGEGVRPTLLVVEDARPPPHHLLGIRVSSRLLVAKQVMLVHSLHSTRLISAQSKLDTINWCTVYTTLSALNSAFLNADHAGAWRDAFAPLNPEACTLNPEP